MSDKEKEPKPEKPSQAELLARIKGSKRTIAMDSWPDSLPRSLRDNGDKGGNDRG